MLVLQVDCGDMRNVDNFGIAGKAGKVCNAGAVDRLWPKLVKLVMLVLQVDYDNIRNVYKFGIVSKISNYGAVGQLWR